MAHTVDSISIRGLRKAHLRQLATYIRERDREGWYYGPREQFERRHADLLKLADRIEAIANDEDARLPNAEAHGRRNRTVDGLVGKFVWVVDDEKYGWQGIFSSKRKAEKALPRLHIGGFGCIVQKVKVQ